MPEEKWLKKAQTYKVTYTCIEVPMPKNYRGQPLNTTWPCGFIKAGDKITFTYAELSIDETDSVCYTTFIDWTGSGRGRKAIVV